MMQQWGNNNYCYNFVHTNWNYFIKTQINEQYFLDLIDFINTQYQSKIIYPKYNKIFECFNYFDYQNTKVVILGQDPYFLENMADGLAFSTKLNIIPKSLNNIFKELKNSLDIDRKNPDLQDWAKQGVLLLNTILTVEQNKPLSHKNKGWEIFVENTIKFIDQNLDNVIFLLMGNNATSYSQLIHNSKHILKTSHPSPFSWKISFYGSNVFKKINLILKNNNKKEVKW